MKRIIQLSICILALSPIFSNAENMALVKIVPEKSLVDSIDAWVVSRELYLKTKFKKEVRIEFQPKAKEFMVQEYKNGMIPQEFSDREKFPFFTELVLLDLEKMVWKAYVFAVSRKYTSLLYFYQELRQKGANVLITNEDVKKSSDYWNCDKFPQPIPPRPPDCVRRTYEKALSYFNQ